MTLAMNGGWLVVWLVRGRGGSLWLVGWLVRGGAGGGGLRYVV